MSSLCLCLLIAAAPSQAAPRALSQQQAIELALGTEPILAQARIAHDRSRLAELRAQLDRVSLKVDGQVQELWGQPPGALQGLSNLSGSLAVPVFSGFRVESAVARAQSLSQASAADLEQQRKDTALAAARLYWAVRRLSLLRDVQAAALDRLTEAEAVAAARTRAGLAPPIDANRAASRRLQQVAALAELDGRIAESAGQLAVALGLSEPVVLTEAPSLPERVAPPVDELLAAARSRRPELRASRQRLEAAHQGVRLAMSDYYPQVGAFALVQVGNNPYLTGLGARSAAAQANPFGDASANLQAGVTLSLNLFDTAQTTTRSRDARYEEARLVEESRRMERVVEAEVRTAHARVIRLATQREALAQAQAVARDNVEILGKRYAKGEALVIELLDGELERVDVDRQLTDATAQLHLAWLELDAALGTTLGGTP